MRTSVKVGAAVAGAALLAASAAAPASAKSPWVKTGASIVGTAVAASGPDAGTPDDNHADFDILIAAIGYAGAGGVFDGTEYTVFAPTDQAFINLADVLDGGATGSVTSEAQAVGVIVANASPSDVLNILATHIVEGTRPAASVVRGQVLTTINGEKLQFKNGTLNSDGSSAGILAANLKTTDGAIHVIDTVLLP